MGVRVSVSVMAHPVRKDQVKSLLRSLGDVSVPVAWDGEGEPRRDHDRVWRTCRAAWGLHDPGADWHLVLQDDAVVARDLLPGLEAAVEHVPGRAGVSLYLGQSRPLPRLWTQLADQARAQEASWVVGPRLMWGVALMLPVASIGAMLAFGDRQGGTPDDQRIGRWVRTQGWESWYPWPSLVDHGGRDSLLGYSLVRRAHSYLAGSAVRDFNPAGPVVRHSRYSW